MELEGHVQNGVIVVNSEEPLPEGTRVKVLLDASQLRQPTLAERLLRHAGTVPGLPEDLAEQHDHYIHGTSKR